MARKVFGKGINDLSGWSSYSNPARRWVYMEWYDMLRRCYSEGFLQKHPTYRGCSVCDRWLRFSNFVADVPKLPGFDKVVKSGFKNMSIDKDMLVIGNREYSTDTCQWVTISKNSSDATKRIDRKFVAQKKDYHIIAQKIGIANGRPVVAVSPNGSVSEYHGAREVERQLGVSNVTVHQCCTCKYVLTLLLVVCSKVGPSIGQTNTKMVDLSIYFII